jgi:hypothetical protein
MHPEFALQNEKVQSGIEAIICCIVIVNSQWCKACPVHRINCDSCLDNMDILSSLSKMANANFVFTTSYNNYTIFKYVLNFAVLHYTNTWHSTVQLA